MDRSYDRQFERSSYDGMSMGELRAHLNMTNDEELSSGGLSLEQIFTAAITHTEGQLGFKLTDETEFPEIPPPEIFQAIYMLAAHWFAQREATIVGVSMTSVPFGYDDIIRSHRRYTFG